MSEQRWLVLEEVIVAHERQLFRFGGPPGIRDRGALESALGRPIYKWQYQNADLAECAAAYAFGLARNHAFVDGNKRIALISLIVFLRLNGIDFEPDEAEAAVIIRDLAAGHVGEEGLTRWVRDRWPAEPKPSRPQRLSRKRPKAEKARPPGRRRLPSRTKKK